jgi:CRP-like cAMP-binding protein
MTFECATAMLEMPLFNGYTKAGVQGLVDQGEVRSYASGDRLCDEGEAADGVLLILSGKLRAYIERRGAQLCVSDFGPGTILGEIAVLCGIPRAASVRALEPSVVLYWNDQKFRSMLLRDVFLSHRIFGVTMYTLIEREKALIGSLAMQQPHSSSVTQ